MSDYKLPALGINYNALTPVFSSEALREHYEKHHRGYCDKLNNALSQINPPVEPHLRNNINQILAEVSKYPQVVINNAGGYFNHNFLWKCLCPVHCVEMPSNQLLQAIKSSYGSYKDMCQSLVQTGMQIFGSGFVWLVMQEDNKLTITSTINQDNPLMDHVPLRGKPLMAIDVWEHAYYLDYKSNRLQYLQDVFQVMTWSLANSYFS